MDYNILTAILTKFTTAATFGYTALIPDAMCLMKYFIVIEIVFLGATIALGKDGGIPVEVFYKIIMIGFYLWLIPNMHDVSRQIIASFGEAGIKAGGYAITRVDLFDPSAIIGFGFDACEPIFRQETKWWNAGTKFIQGFSGIFILLAFFIIGWQMFMAIIEFYIITVLSVILIPFGLFRPLSFLCEKAISLTFAAGIKFMVVTFCIGLSYNTLRTIGLPADPTLQQCMVVLLAAGTIAVLCWQAPQIAMGFVGGAPNLTGGSVLGPALSAAMIGRMAVGRGGSTPQSGLNHNIGRLNANIEKVLEATKH